MPAPAQSHVANVAAGSVGRSDPDRTGTSSGVGPVSANQRTRRVNVGGFIGPRGHSPSLVSRVFLEGFRSVCTPEPLIPIDTLGARTRNIPGLRGGVGRTRK